MSYYPERHIVPTSFTITTGNSSSIISDMTVMNDGNIFDLKEVSGSPGIDFKINFTEVVMFRKIVIKNYYNGSLSHYNKMMIFNYITSTYDIFDTCLNTLDFVLHTITIPSDIVNNYIQNGNLIFRYNHPITGNSGHHLYIDYISLII